MNREDNEEKDFDINFSMTDLMTSLMVIFILLLVVTLNKVSNGGEQQRDIMIRDLQQQINEKTVDGKFNKIKLEIDKDDPLSFTYNIDETNGLKFKSNKSDILPESKENLKRSYEILLDSVCKNDKVINGIDSIQIIGYTDANPVIADPKFGNLSLSQDRALSVLKFGLYQVGTDTPKGKCLLKLASINGRGMENPKPTYAESRRVEFKIKFKSYEQYKNMENKFKNK